MIRTIAASFTFSFIIVASWAAQIVCYHDQTIRLDPLAPITFTVVSTAAHD